MMESIINLFSFVILVGAAYRVYRNYQATDEGNRPQLTLIYASVLVISVVLFSVVHYSDLSWYLFPGHEQASVEFTLEEIINQSVER